MNKLRLTLGIIATAISSVILIFCFILITANVITSATLTYGLLSFFSLIIGILAIATSGNSREKQEFEEYKRMKQQETAMYYRYANAKGKPIEEYMMNPRQKLMVYYDRLPSKYQQQLVDKADQLYRKFENEQYTQK